jgi:hypothetical protein
MADSSKMEARTWAPEVAELRRREDLARQMGGKNNVERQQAAGRQTVRQRIDQLLDPGSFHETGALAGVPTCHEGKLPSCVETCPTRALESGDLDELKARFGAQVEAEGFRYSRRTAPAVIFKPKRPVPTT